MEKTKLVRVLADIEPKLKKELYKALIDENLTFNAWIRQQIVVYLEARQPAKRRKRGGRHGGGRREEEEVNQTGCG